MAAADSSKKRIDRAGSLTGAIAGAILGGALLALGALWLFYRSGDPLVAPQLNLSGTSLQRLSGEGEPTPGGIAIRQSGTNGIVMVQAAIQRLEAAHYRRLIWRVDGLKPEQETRLVWATDANPSAPYERILRFDRRGNGKLDLDREPDWRGRIIAIGLVVKGTLDAPILVRSLTLRPAAPTLALLLRTLVSDWTHREGWSGRSINFNYGAPRNARLPPVPMVALWVGLSALTFAFLNPSWRARRMLTPYAFLLLLGWLALDLRWQWELSQRLRQTAASYAGLDETGRQQAGPDRKLYPFLQAVLRHLPPPSARVFILSQDPGGANAGRVRYRLLPHNAYLSATLPDKANLRPDDYLLILSPLREVRHDRERHLLISGATQLPAELLYAADQGALYRFAGAFESVVN